MILVTLGTQDKKFYRLLDIVQNAIKQGVIKDKVIVQAGYSFDYKSDDMEILNLVSIDKFKKLISECDILITHGGVGSIISGLKENKKIIAVPRLKKYKEHTNNHQVQIVDNFASEGYILKLDDGEDLSYIIESINDFTPKEYKSNHIEFIKTVSMEIEKYLK